MKLETYREKIKKAEDVGMKRTSYIDRQNTKWAVEIKDKCEHEWQPIQMRMEVDGFAPDINKCRVYCVCMKCCGHTYIETAWVGYYIGSPDLLEEPED